MNKFFLGLVIFPIAPIALYFTDILILNRFLADFIQVILEYFGLTCVEGRLDFYCFPYQRTVFFIAVLMSPIFFAYWLKVISMERAKSFGFRDSFHIHCLVVSFFLIFLALAFLPVELGGNLSRKKIAIARFRGSLAGFTLIVYWSLFFNFMLLAGSIKHVSFMIRRNMYANTI